MGQAQGGVVFQGGEWSSLFARRSLQSSRPERAWRDGCDLLGSSARLIGLELTIRWLSANPEC